MRKLLISILMLILFAIFVLMIVYGLTIGNVRLGYSVKEVIDKNDELDNNIANLGAKIRQEYDVAKSNLNASFDALQQEKETYQQKIAFSTEEEIQAANQSEKYKLDYLWTNIGLYATRNNVAMRADITYGTSGAQGQYNISFTATGEYISISDFVYDVEKDPELGFRIEEFQLVPYSENALQATFIIRNVPIDSSSLSTVTSTTEKDDTNTNTNTEGNTNTNTTPKNVDVPGAVANMGG